MLLSVIIPVYKEEEQTIIRAVDSVKNQYGFSPEDVEIILSCDLPGREINIPGVRVLSTTNNSGPGVARQRGIDNANGDYVSFLDADDIWFNLLALDMIKHDAQQEAEYIKFPFLEEKADGIQANAIDSTWCFSKVYKRQYLIDNKIAFDPFYRVHEDSFFVRSLEMHHPRTFEHGDNIYLWTNNPNSTVRQNDGIYWQSSFPVYLEVVYRLAKMQGDVNGDNRQEYIYNFCYAYANISRMDETYEAESLAELKKHVEEDDIALITLMENDVCEAMHNINMLPNLPMRMPKYTFEEFKKKVLA